MKDKPFIHKTEITCYTTICKFNTSHRSEFKRGYCKAGKIAVGRKGCLEKDTGLDMVD